MAPIHSAPSRKSSKSPERNEGSRAEGVYKLPFEIAEDGGDNLFIVNDIASPVTADSVAESVAKFDEFMRRKAVEKVKKMRGAFKICVNHLATNSDAQRMIVERIHNDNFRNGNWIGDYLQVDFDLISDDLVERLTWRLQKLGFMSMDE